MEKYMDNLQQSMKYSLVLGLAGAVILPVSFEIYANIWQALGYVLIGIWSVVSGLKFSSLKFREAFVGMFCTIAYGGIFGFLLYLLIHPVIKNALEKKSVYFQLSLSQEAGFVLYAFVIMLCMFVVWTAKTAILSAFRKMAKNREKTGEYIENAFDDEKEENK